MVAACVAGWLVRCVVMQLQVAGDEGGPAKLARYLTACKEERERIKVLVEARRNGPIALAIPTSCPDHVLLWC